MLGGVFLKKKLQVFVSSTYQDLIEERQKAVEGILRAGHIPAGMELFTAASKSQWKVIEEWKKRVRPFNAHIRREIWYY